MKCIKNRTGTIKRVSNTTAEHLTKTSHHTYCSKAEWKTAGRAFGPDNTKERLQSEQALQSYFNN